jgi:peptide/nickel transport system permease protein
VAAKRIARAVGAKLALTILTLVFVSVVVYTATQVIPADPAKVFLGKTATPQQVARFREEQGLDRGPVSGYLHWAGNFIHGDLGESIVTQEPVSETVLPRLGRTMLLALFAFVIAAPLAFALGLASGKRPDSTLDTGLSFGVLGLAGVPEFAIGVVLLTVFAVSLGWFPVSSGVVLFGSPAERFQAYVLPAVTLALVVLPHMTRQVRIAVREVVAAPYIRAAALRGLTYDRLTWKHVVPMASGRVVNVMALNLAELLAGVVVVETVFGFPGIGRQLVEAINSNDITVVQAVTVIIGACDIVINFLADALVIVLNPRLRRTGAS